MFPEYKDADEDTLMRARITHEYTERDALEQERQGLLKKKQELIADNKKRRDDLANLDQDLEKFIDVCSTRIWHIPYDLLTMTGCQTNTENFPKRVLKSYYDSELSNSSSVRQERGSRMISQLNIPSYDLTLCLYSELLSLHCSSWYIHKMIVVPRPPG